MAQAKKRIAIAEVKVQRAEVNALKRGENLLQH
jgi:hypothetical protein